MTQSKSRLCWRACCALVLAYGGYFEACVDHGVCQSLIEDDKDTSQLISLRHVPRHLRLSANSLVLTRTSGVVNSDLHPVVVPTVPSCSP